MRVLVTGATGFVGRALVLRLLREGHAVTAWTRNADRARDLLGPDVTAANIGEGHSLAHEVRRADAVVNLAGENLFSGRWTSGRKERIRASRVGLTSEIARALEAADDGRERVLVSASAVGFYGDRGALVLDESARSGGDFLAGVCREWEAAARAATSETTRVTVLRLGLVLGSEGGAMSRLLPLFRLGLGGRLGDGEQFVSWIHLHDLVAMIVRALHDDSFTGTFNATAPHPVTNAEQTRAVAEAVGRRTGPAVPAIALRAALGEASGVLLASQRVVPARAMAFDFAFALPRIEDALAQITDASRAPCIADADRGVRPMEDRPAAQYVLEQHTTISAPLDEVFPFFSEAANLALLTPTWTDFRILEHPDRPTVAGDHIVYRLKLGGVPIRWKTLIAEWAAGERFVDTQLSGPYRLWWHEHAFAERDGAVHMVDRVHYTIPFGPLGRIANRLFVAPLLKRIFAWRAEAISLRFDPPGPAPVGSTSRNRSAA